MKRTIHHLRKQPAEVRWNVTIITSFAVTALVASAWIMSNPFEAKFADTDADGANQLAAPLIAVGEDTAGLFRDTQKRLEAFETAFDR
jgi:cytochrome c biogenesis factor